MLTQFVLHFTNWAWTYAIVFFLATLGFPCSSSNPRTRCCNVTCAASVITVCFWPLNAIAWFVFIAVFVLLLAAPAFITSLFLVIEPGLVMVANDIFHFFPVLALIVYVFAHQQLIWYATNRTCVAAANRGGGCVALFVTYATCGGALLLFSLYAIVLAAITGKSVAEWYAPGMGISAVWAFVGLVGTGLIINGLALTCMFVYTNLLNDENVGADALADKSLVLYNQARAMAITEVELLTDAPVSLHAHLNAAATAAITGTPLADLHRDLDDVVAPPRLSDDDINLWL